MTTPSVGSDRLRRPGPGYAVEEDHFLSWITAVVAGVGALAVVVPFLASATRSSVGLRPRQSGVWRSSPRPAGL